MKFYTNKKIMLGGLTMLLLLAIIIVTSFFPFILDPSRIGTKEFITDQLIIGAITITSTISMMFISQASNGQNPKSEIAKAKVSFETSLKRITRHSSFYQWIKKVLQVNDKKDIVEKSLLKLGVDLKVWDLTNNEIRSLTTPQKINDIYYKSLTKKQIQAILGLKKRVKTIKFVSPNYYTSCKSYLSDKNLSELASNENEKKVLTIVFQLFFKITLTFIFSAILASLVRDLTQQGGSTAQSWLRFLSRMFAFITSSFLGYMLGCKINDLDAFYILKRIEAHTLYVEDKYFVAVDEAKEEYERAIIGGCNNEQERKE